MTTADLDDIIKALRRTGQFNIPRSVSTPRELVVVLEAYCDDEEDGEGSGAPKRPGGDSDGGALEMSMTALPGGRPVPQGLLEVLRETERRAKLYSVR
jgi:hypothetical protein